MMVSYTRNMTDSNQNEVRTSPGYSAKALNSFCAQAISDILLCSFYPFALFLVIGAVVGIPIHLLRWTEEWFSVTAGTYAFIASFATCVSWTMLPFVPAKFRFALCFVTGLLVTSWVGKVDFSWNIWIFDPIHTFWSLLHPRVLDVQLPAYLGGIFSSSAMYFDEKFIRKKSPTIVPTILVENSIEP